MIKPLVALGVLALHFYIYHWFATTEVIPPRESFASFPLQLGDWVCRERERMDEKTIENLGASDYLICDYRREEPRADVLVYLGYHETQIRREGGGAGENSIHPPKHCLPGSGWDIIGQGMVFLDLPGLPERPALVNRLVIAKGEARQLVYYWYQTQGRVIAEDWRKIVYLSWDRARTRRTDGALVRLTVPIYHKDDDAAEQQLLEVAGLLLPRLEQYVPE
jgi:EpsI family protein